MCYSISYLFIKIICILTQSSVYVYVCTTGLSINSHGGVLSLFLNYYIYNINDINYHI